MNWPSFLSPWWGLLGLAAIPIIALYILRQKRPDLPVSSTFLWNKALADMRASSPWQRLRRNLLLLLQLLILAALVFVMMRPIIQAQASAVKAGVIVIDATASMQARDGGGASRLERAKEEARRLVEGMRPGDRFMLIADGGGLNQVRSGFSTSKVELKRLIDEVRASDTGSDLSESLLLAASSLRAIGNASEKEKAGVTAGQIWLLSDGAGVKLPDIFANESNSLQFIRIGESSNSVGVTRLVVTPVPKEPRTYQVFVGLLNASKEDRRVGVALALGAKENLLPEQARFAELAPGATGGVVFEKVVSDPGKLFVRVDDRDDDFPLDNTAYATIEPVRKPRVVLVTTKSPLLENFLKTSVKVAEVEGQIVSPEHYNADAAADLVIFDSVTPAKLPRCDTLFIRPAASVAGFKATHEIENPAVLRWRREDPVMSFVELGELRVGKAIRYEKDGETVDLVTALEGPLVAYRNDGPARRYLVAFSPTLESNWWMQPSLLIFLQNIVEQTRTRNFIGAPQIIPTGQAARILDVERNARVQLPSGQVMEQTNDRGAVEFAATDLAGFYEVDVSGRKMTFAANLFNSTESSIGPQSLQTVSGGNVEEATSVATVNREIWPWLAVAALAVLMLEWFVYHRRLA